ADGNRINGNPAWSERELALVDELRLVSVHRLRRLGMSFGQIAGELGVTPRHAPRLSAASLFLALRCELVRRDAAQERSEREAVGRTKQVPRRRRGPCRTV